LDKDKPQQLQVHYADMLEVVRTLIVATKTNINNIDVQTNQTVDWYKNASPSKQKLTIARIDLLQKFDELLKMKTEAIKDQLLDMLESFKQLLVAHKLSFVQVEQTRRTMYKRLGGFSKGVYLESVSKIKTHTV
jgi:predicted house-cleaning noncanonical NTP pyrophosphatase (MazG superfamily)